MATVEGTGPGEAGTGRPEAELLAARCPVSYAIFAMARVHRGLAASRLAAFGLYPGQEILLMELAGGDGRPQKQLAATLQVSHVTVAKMVARMEQAGLVRRQTSDHDRRVSLVFLTDRGRELQQQMLDAWLDLEAAATRYLSDADGERFVALSAAVRRSLDETASPTDYQPG